MGPAVSVKETSDGRQIVHYDGHPFELRPSPGEVFCAAAGGAAIHHDKDCGHITDSTQDTPLAYPDPGKDLWQRLLASAPRSDEEGRRAFGVSAGLHNGRGGAISQLCRTCTLVPLVTWSGIRSPSRPLSEALAEFDRAARARRIEIADAEMRQVVEDFPLDAWPSMPLERYALGTDMSHDSFCYRMEFGTPALSSMRGGHAGKHIIYRRRSDDTWYQRLGSDEHEAWEKVRDGFVAAFTLASEGRITDIDAIDALRSGPMLTAKAVSCYFPDTIIPINSRDHVRNFIFHLSGDDTKLETFAAHERLKQLIEADTRFAGWHPYEVGIFLYWWADPRPATTKILKVAPGEKAKYWNECRAEGYMCIGWDDVGDLTEFTSEDEFRERFEAMYSGLYNGHKSTVSKKAGELWRFFRLEPGDRVVANRGIKEVLAVGTVTEDGYRWRDERPEYRNTVSVEWDTGYAQTLAEPQKAWGTVTVAPVQAALWKTIQAGAGSRPSEIVPTNELFEKIAGLLERKGQVVLYGPPGTGKTYTSLRFALWWLAAQLPDTGLDPLAEYGTADFRRALDAMHEAGHLTQVTFHPAYGYEDFIEGFRPVEGGDAGLRLDLRDGIFKRVCETAAANPERPYLLLIDEINRGDIPKILGELITLLEPDKRGMHVTLPTGKRFAVPSNVHVLGTMNTADRSIRLLDSALRRRFAFHELLPDTEVLNGQKVGNVDLGLLLGELNGRVVKELGRERQIGHSFFLPGGRPVDSEAELAAIIRTEVLPLLQEYAYDDYSLLSRFLGEKIVDVQAHTVAGLSDEGLVEALAAELRADESG